MLRLIKLTKSHTLKTVTNPNRPFHISMENFLILQIYNLYIKALMFPYQLSRSAFIIHVSQYCKHRLSRAYHQMQVYISSIIIGSMENIHLLQRSILVCRGSIKIECFDMTHLSHISIKIFGVLANKSRLVFCLASCYLNEQSDNHKNYSI